VQRLKTRAQFEAAMAGGTVSRTAHFVLHRAPSTSPDSLEAPDTRLRGIDGLAIGAVVPKRWAKRAVTRNGIKRQIYNVSAAFEPRLPAAAHVVRLRGDFARAQFPSAWSDALKAAVRGELLQLFERSVAVPARSAVAPAATPVIPAKAGIQGSQQ
jgi:ribonuclease P protein component